MAPQIPIIAIPSIVAIIPRRFASLLLFALSNLDPGPSPCKSSLAFPLYPHRYNTLIQTEGSYSQDGIEKGALSQRSFMVYIVAADKDRWNW